MHYHKSIHSYLLSALLAIAAVLVLALIIAGLSSSKSVKLVEFPPSIVYADNDTTVLGSYSNVKNQFNLAPYFCASLEDDLNALFAQKDASGQFVYRKSDGSPYNIYEDELSIYTTLNPSMQQYAEEALAKHLKEDLQPAFTKNNANTKHYPFCDSYDGHKITRKDVKNIMTRAREESKRFQVLTRAGKSKAQINKSFNQRVAMKVFTWRGEVDTILTPNDSIRFIKNFIQSSLLSIEPSTGSVKALVGGIDFDHFPLDHVKTTRAQAGSTIKSFVYATAMSMGVINPCTEFTDSSYCIDPCDPNGRRWCPSGTPSGTVKNSFAMSTGGTNVSVMSLMGACEGPENVAALLERMNISIPDNLITPAICLGTPDLSLYENVAAQAMFVNNGTFIAPRTIVRITDRDGNEIYASLVKSIEVMNPTVAFEQLQLMKGVVNYGTSTSLKWSPKWGGITAPTAGITGTTQGNANGWFIGLTPDLVTGIWGGADDKPVRFRSMTWGQGARMALPIYGYYMQKIYADSALSISTSDFIRPDDYDTSFFTCGHIEH